MPSAFRSRLPCRGRGRTAYRALSGSRIVVGALLAFIVPATVRAGDAGTVDFSRDVLPILSENCLLCHGPDTKTRKADLRLDVKESALRSKEPVIVAGKSGESELIRRIESEDPEEVMPPPKAGHKLTDQQKETLKRWIDQGAKWGKHWAFEPPRRPELPHVKDQRWPRNPIDHFVLARLEAEGLHPSAEADRTTLIRRLSLDLIGLPPTPAEVDAFVTSSSPRAYEELVDRLLSSAHYGERMAMDWLDGARYADTNGYQNDFARTMWPWRDWVISAFNRNQPFDRFVIDQIAGDLLPGATLEQKVATGFNRNNRTVTEAGSIDEEWRIENAVDRVETTATVFLGLTMGCCRCHEHKYDPISQKEFYSFLAFFNSIKEQGVYTEQRGNVPPLVQVPEPEDRQQLQSLDAKIASAVEARALAEKSLPGRQARWEREQRDGTEPAESKDWALRCALDGDLRFQGPSGETVLGTFRGKDATVWVDGPRDKAIRFEGKAGAFVEVEHGPSLDRTDRFSYGGWIKQRGDGACLSKMDDRNGYRGYDLLIDQGKVEVHLVHSWPADALKVATKEPLPRDVWTHVFVTHDGSGKAAGLKIFFDGRPVALDTRNDSLKGSTVTEEPLRLGQRSSSSPFHGDLADVRIYRRTLSPEDVRELASGPMLAIARLTPERRSKSQQDRLRSYYRSQVDPELRRADEHRVPGPQGESRARGSPADRDGDGGPARAEGGLRAQARTLRHAGPEPEGRSGRPGFPRLTAGRLSRQPARSGSLARLARQSAHGQGGREPALAAALRDRAGQDHRELRPPGRGPLAPGAPRLAGDRVRPHRLGHESHAPADRHERDVPTIFEGLSRADPARPGEPAHGAGAQVPPAGRAGPRQRPGDRRAAVPHGSAGRRSSRTSPPGSGKSSPAGQGRARTSRTRARTSIAAASTSTASGPCPTPPCPPSTPPRERPARSSGPGPTRRCRPSSCSTT